ncbi:MAG: formate dehydrogenase subunit alpha [Lachnospiraceae bacterium]|nr:formate dehydrogenase subunit alpha [Lachnospiraceae bacterium]
MIELTINGKSCSAEKGDTILKVARDNDIYIPTLCFLEGVNDIGSCRMCMVEAEGYDRLLAACNTKARDGMVITTESDRLTEYRKDMLRLLLSDHNRDCLSCPGNGGCELQELCNKYDVDKPDHPGARANVRDKQVIIDKNPYISYDPSKCIHCQRCINVCHRITCNGAIKSGRLGNLHIVEAPFGEGYKSTGCESCGNCAEVCPTGALTLKRRKQYREWEVKKVLTTCPHCATGCQFYLVVKDNKIVNVESAEGPANRRRLCVKGRNASFDFVQSPDRLKKPLIKDKATGEFRECSWEEAISYAAKGLMDIKEKYGSEALGGFACSRSSNEDVYMVQKMVRTCFGTNTTDNCARVCHSASVAGLAMTLGSGAMTNPIRDITEDVDVIMLVGSNPEEAHPVVGMQIRRAVKRGTRLIVVDPRDIGLASVADIHLKLRPGTNVAFANGMMNVMIAEDLIDHDYIENHSEGFEELKKLVADYTPSKVAKICHIDADKLVEAARMYAKANKAPIIYCLGVTEHSTGTEGVMSMSNMAVLCGKIGRSGCGVNPLRGQNNVQGACDMGAMSTDYPGYQKVDKEEVRKKFEEAWGVPLNPNAGLRATEVFPAAIKGEIKGLYICGEDPVVSDPDTNHVIKALESMEFLVVQDLFMTKTARYADVVLPAKSYAEKEGTFTNTERRVQRIRTAITLEGEMRSDTDIIIDLMNAMGYKQPYLTPAQIMDEIASLTPSYAGISHERLDAGESLQWPCKGKDHPGTPIMHVGGPARGKAYLYPAVFREAQELPDEEYPYILMTGRILYHYNAFSMTSRSPGLMEIEGEGYIEMNFKDAESLGVKTGDFVNVTSRRGSIKTRARVGRKVSPGETWMPFHFPDSPVNMITNAALDKYARIPEYKVCAIQITKA